MHEMSSTFWECKKLQRSLYLSYAFLFTGKTESVSLTGVWVAVGLLAAFLLLALIAIGALLYFRFGEKLRSHGLCCFVFFKRNYSVCKLFLFTAAGDAIQQYDVELHEPSAALRLTACVKFLDWSHWRQLGGKWLVFGLLCHRWLHVSNSNCLTAIRISLLGSASENGVWGQSLRGCNLQPTWWANVTTLESQILDWLYSRVD